MILSNFYNKLWYTPKVERESVKPSAFLLQSPSFKLYTQIGKPPSDTEGIIPESLDELLLSACIKDSLNVEGLTSYLELPKEIQQDLLDTIISFYYPDTRFFEKLSFSLDATLDSKFSADSWDCTKCQAKGIHKQKNCPLLDPKEYHDPEYSITVGEQTFSTCPMLDKDISMINLAFEANRIAESGFLPEAGAYGDQPLLFCLLSQKVKDKLKYYENKQMEDTRKQSR